MSKDERIASGALTLCALIAGILLGTFLGSLGASETTIYEERSISRQAQQCEVIGDRFDCRKHSAWSEGTKSCGCVSIKGATLEFENTFNKGE